MKVDLVFHDWLNEKGESVYNSQDGFYLTLGAFHAGSTVPAEIELDEEQVLDLQESISMGFKLLFLMRMK
jgi:hypothetical protein